MPTPPSSTPFPGAPPIGLLVHSLAQSHSNVSPSWSAPATMIQLHRGSHNSAAAAFRRDNKAWLTKSAACPYHCQTLLDREVRFAVSAERAGAFSSTGFQYPSRGHGFGIGILFPVICSQTKQDETKMSILSPDTTTRSPFW